MKPRHSVSILHGVIFFLVSYPRADEAHEFPKANPPLAAYERASKLALVYDDDVEIMWRFARAAYNLAGPCLRSSSVFNSAVVSSCRGPQHCPSRQEEVHDRGAEADPSCRSNRQLQLGLPSMVRLCLEVGSVLPSCMYSLQAWNYIVWLRSVPVKQGVHWEHVCDGGPLEAGSDAEPNGRVRTPPPRTMCARARVSVCVFIFVFCLSPLFLPLSV